jgi:hypothetical protein
MAKQDFFGDRAQGNASRSERAIFLLLICYLVEEVARPLFSFLARSFHFPAAGPRLRH